MFATEVRRRLFWELRLIDLGSAEDCGFLPTHIYGADTRLPLNINDIDITPEALIPPAEREGFTDMTYTLVRVSRPFKETGDSLTNVQYQLCNRLHRLYHHEGKSSMGPLQGDRKEIPELAQALADCRSIIRSKHLQYCSESIPFQKVTLWVGQIILAKQSLLVQYPLFHSSCRSTPISKDLRDELLRQVAGFSK